MIDNAFLKLRVVVSCPQFSDPQTRVALEIVYPFGSSNDRVKNSARYKENLTAALSSNDDLSPTFWIKDFCERTYEFTFSKMGVSDIYDRMLFRKLLSNAKNTYKEELLLNTSTTDVAKFEVLSQTKPESDTNVQLCIKLYIGNIGTNEEDDIYYELYF